MSSPFGSNWVYLKAELAWLDRLLMRAITRQQQNQKVVNRVAQTAADRASSHWWQGFVNIDPSQGGSMIKVTPVSHHPRGRYGDRLQSSQEQGVVLAIPDLCQKLNLRSWERNTLILCLAPEINRRYEKLYAYLNGDETNCRQPTVDLALRLFCPSDAAWCEARPSFSAKAPLLKHRLIELHDSPSTARSLLSKVLVMPPKAVSHCLAEQAPPEKFLPKPRSRAQAKLN
ncbi:MAG: hypothetical protein HC919_00660 [Oscillatoriales cyanobacterium SM2_2_1]|nr:hypothetical protein [Oscillatoriales cyanobacterium SM2_2_1]